MKKILVIVLFISSVFMFSCKQNDENVTDLQNQIEELKKEIENVYKPGFGEIMGNIQTHHAKLWFAGKNQNWKLAEFEIHEIREGFEGIEKYQRDRKESEMTAMIKPSLDSVAKAIEENNFNQFVNNYKLLTNTCNICHKSTDYEFIQLNVPDFQPNINQVFEK